MEISFAKKEALLKDQFKSIPWIEESGLSVEVLEESIGILESSHESKAIIKAKTLLLIAEKGRIAIDPNDIFQDKLFGGNIIKAQRKRWETAVKEKFLRNETAEIRRAWKEFGAYTGNSDYGHTSPNSKLLLEEGLTGILKRVTEASEAPGISNRQAEYYESCKLALNAVITVANRLAKTIAPYNRENSIALSNIANGKPQNSYEAMQLLILYFFMHEYIGATRVRTLGRLDVLLYPFYIQDLKSGRFTHAEIKEMLKFFLYKFWNAKVPFDLPFCLGGMDESGNDITSEVSALIVEAYDELNIYSPKIHIRVSKNTPQSFIKQVLSCIRKGNSSFVFVNDMVGIKALTAVGIEESDARNFVPIGCYEPAVWGVEIGCTGNGGVNLAKAVELVCTNGKDQRSGILCGLETGEIASFDEFKNAVKQQIAYMTEKALSYIVEIEKHYSETNPDPLLSAQYEESVRRGVDVFEGGAKYNNSSLYFYCIASLIDSMCAVKRLVFEEARYSFSQLAEILKNDFNGYEKDRILACRLPEKYGNGNPSADALTVEMSDFCASIVNNRPNGRGGVFKAAMFSIDHYVDLGQKTMATPDGRHAGDLLSKNLCASVSMDRNGITALIHSVTKIDHSKFPTGSVLDIMLHPSAVAGEEGLHAFYSILMTYFEKGGFAMHGNVFDAEILKDAKKHPDQYRNLQVRVCGWNAYFINLSEAEQDAFILQAESQA